MLPPRLRGDFQDEPAWRLGRFARHVPTDGRSVDQVVEDVAAGLDLPLRRPRQRPPVAFLRRRVGQLRDLRLL